MKEKIFLALLFLIPFSISAQIKGVVKDSITGKPVPYVSIWVENENNGTTSEEDGTFVVNISEKSKTLIFSALGYEKKKIKALKAIEVNLKQTPYQLEEIVISKRKETKEVEIGNTKNEILEAFDNGPRIAAKFFPYSPSYKRTKYIKQVTIFTDSRIENATIKIHFFSVDSIGFPGKELIDKDFIVSVSKGVKKTAFNVSKFNLRMPKNGIFVGFEKLMIENNKAEKVATVLNANTSQTQKKYFPFVLYNYVERKFSFTFSGGKWNRETKQNESDSPNKMMIYEPAINLILTN
jgi:hypothetical protein